MLIIPAIDIINGKVVRLEKGDFNKEKVYSSDPLEAAKTWEEKGAKFLHIVDLDGARAGKAKNVGVIVNIIKNISPKNQLSELLMILNKCFIFVYNTIV